MIAQDLTKFTFVLVILGIVLAVAIFRPQILPSPPIEPTEEPEPNRLTGVRLSPGPEQGEGATLSHKDLVAWQEEVESRQGDLEQLQAELDLRIAELDQRQDTLDRREVELDEREAGLDQSQRELDQLKAEMNRQWDELEGHKAELKEQVAFQQTAEARLRQKEASLAEREQKLQGFLRWSVVAVAVSGLLAVPSVLVLVVLMRQDQWASSKGVERVRDSRPHQREHVARHGRLATVAPASIHGGDGRGKESVGYSAVGGR